MRLVPERGSPETIVMKLFDMFQALGGAPAASLDLKSARYKGCRRKRKRARWCSPAFWESIDWYSSAR